MNVRGPGPVIRLNEEVKGVAQGRVNRAINKGEQVRGSDIVELKGLDLLPENHDAAHLTALLHASGWQVIFDFRYNATTISCLVARRVSSLRPLISPSRPVILTPPSTIYMMQLS
jgi:hypothetical protein